MRRFAGFFLFSILLILAGCQKEFSIETSNNLSSGSLQSELTGDCLPKVVSGIYEKLVPLDGLTNTIDVTVDVQSTGTYKIITDTVNGFYFSATGIFTSTGVKTVTLKGGGTPLADGIANFTVTYDKSNCVVSVTVLPAGGASPAVMTLAGSPTTCMGYVVTGSYILGKALTSASYVDIQVNVTTAGTYSVATPVSNGFSFSGTGAVTTTGTTTIRLYATGTPATSGPTNVPVTIGTSSCSFSVNVVSGATFTVSCGTASVDGDYIAGVDLDATNTVDITVDVTVLGGYTLTGTINGMTFTGSGEFTSLGTQLITLDGTGKPTSSGLFNVPLTGATNSCTFEVVVFPAGKPATGTWLFTKAGVGTPFSGAVTEAVFDPNFYSPNLYFYFYGINPGTGDQILVELVDASGGIQTGEVYTLSSMTGNTGAFTFIGASAEFYADPTITGNTLKITITNHDVTNKKITATYTGKAEDENGVLQDITGTFNVDYN